MGAYGGYCGTQEYGERFYAGIAGFMLGILAGHGLALARAHRQFRAPQLQVPFQPDKATRHISETT